MIKAINQNKVYRRIVPVPDFCPRHLYHFVPGEDSKLENRGQNGTRVICVYVNMSPPEMTHSEHYVKHVCPNMNSIWTQFDILWPQSDPMRPILWPMNTIWTKLEHLWPQIDPIFTQFEPSLTIYDPSYDVTCNMKWIICDGYFS